MNFFATKHKVFNRGVAPDSFLATLVGWGRHAADEIFLPNKANDIYTQVAPELGPLPGASPIKRRAIMLEVMRVLAGFESEWNWNCGIDTTRTAKTTPENSEAGAWQVSYDSRDKGEDLQALLDAEYIRTGRDFQVRMKEDHLLAMEYVARLMRHTAKHNGPLYRNRGIFPKELQGPEQSIYPWVRRDAVAEFVTLLA